MNGVCSKAVEFYKFNSVSRFSMAIVLENFQIFDLN
jgi:hypothetical protein